MRIQSGKSAAGRRQLKGNGKRNDIAWEDNTLTDRNNSQSPRSISITPKGDIEGRYGQSSTSNYDNRSSERKELIPGVTPIPNAQEITWFIGENREIKFGPLDYNEEKGRIMQNRRIESILSRTYRAVAA